MKLPHIRARAAAVGGILIAGSWLALLSCSSDPNNALGSDSDLLGSEPGVVYQDTIGVTDDTTYVFNTPIATDTDLEIGQDAVFRRTIVVQPGFSELDQFPGDRTRTVESASLHFYTLNLKGNFGVRFYGLGRKYVEGDTISGLDQLTNTIPDENGVVDRNFEPAAANYSIPDSLAQKWIRDETSREAVVIVYTDTANDHIGTVPAFQATSDQPYLSVRFTDGTERGYDIRNDATVYVPRSVSSNLAISDGYPRRMWMRAHLDSLAKDSAVHTAHMRFHIVPGSLYSQYVVDSLQTVKAILYIPDSKDPASAAFKTGQRITHLSIQAGQSVVDFPMANAIALVLEGKLKNNGFAIRCEDENTVPRSVEFYGSSAPDSLRPKVVVTSSTPAVFH